MNKRSEVNDHGFAVLPEIISRHHAQLLADELEHSEMKRTKAGIRHALKHPLVSDLASASRLIGIAQEILGRNALPFRATLFDKSAEANWLVVWHQDTALPLSERRDIPGWGPWSVKDGVIYAHAPADALRRVVALRVHLDDSNEDNGPLRVLPGTHKQGVLSDDDIQELAARIRPIDCLVPQGAVLAIRPLIVHASSKSDSDKPRRVLHIEYAASKLVGENLELAIA